MPQITASTARRCTLRLLSSSAVKVCPCEIAVAETSARAATMALLMCPSASERIDVVQDRHLPQQHAADDVADRDVVGEDRRGPGGASRQRLGELRVVEPDADHKGHSGDGLGCDGFARDLG